MAHPSPQGPLSRAQRAHRNKPVVLQSQVLHQQDILWPAVVVITRHISCDALVGLPWGVGPHIPDALCTATFIPATLNLQTSQQKSKAAHCYVQQYKPASWAERCQTVHNIILVQQHSVLAGLKVLKRYGTFSGVNCGMFLPIGTTLHRMCAQLKLCLPGKQQLLYPRLSCF